MEYNDDVMVLDAKGLACPLPLLKTKQALASLSANMVLRVETTDSGSVKDIPSYIALTKHQLVEQFEENDHIVFMIRKSL